MKRIKNAGIISLDTLILFVAIVIVVGVTAIFLMTIGGSLQQKSMIQASEGKKDVTSGIEVISIIGTDASSSGGSPHHVENLHMMVRLFPGGIHLNLNTTLIHLEQPGGVEQTLTYNTTCSSECTAPTTSKFNVYYLKSGPYYEAGYVNLGDIAKLSINLSSAIGEDEDVRLSIFPSYGPRTLIKFQTSQNMIGQRVTLWPVP